MPQATDVNPDTAGISLRRNFNAYISNSENAANAAEDILAVCREQDTADSNWVALMFSRPEIVFRIILKHSNHDRLQAFFDGLTPDERDVFQQMDIPAVVEDGKKLKTSEAAKAIQAFFQPALIAPLIRKEADAVYFHQEPLALMHCLLGYNSSIGVICMNKIQREVTILVDEKVRLAEKKETSQFTAVREKTLDLIEQKLAAIERQVREISLPWDDLIAEVEAEGPERRARAQAAEQQRREQRERQKIDLEQWNKYKEELDPKGEHTILAEWCRGDELPLDTRRRLELIEAARPGTPVPNAAEAKAPNAGHARRRSAVLLFSAAYTVCDPARRENMDYLPTLVNSLLRALYVMILREASEVFQDCEDTSLVKEVEQKYSTSGAAKRQLNAYLLVESMILWTFKKAPPAERQVLVQEICLHVLCCQKQPNVREVFAEETLSELVRRQAKEAKVDVSANNRIVQQAANSFTTRVTQESGSWAQYTPQRFFCQGTEPQKQESKQQSLSLMLLDNVSLCAMELAIIVPKMLSQLSKQGKVNAASWLKFLSSAVKVATPNVASRLRSGGAAVVRAMGRGVVALAGPPISYQPTVLPCLKDDATDSPTRARAKREVRQVLQQRHVESIERRYQEIAFTPGVPPGGGFGFY